MNSNIEMLAARYSGHWKLFQYLTGLGFQIYNKYKNKFEVDVYRKLFSYLLTKDGFKSEMDAEVTMYWDAEDTGYKCKVDMLVNGNIIFDVYAVDRIDDGHRIALKNKMKLTHVMYGMIANFDRDRLYTERYVRDEKTGIIDKV